MNINFSQLHVSLNRIGKISMKNVANADQTVCEFLRENSPKRLKELAQMNCYAADKIKRVLDNKYGKDGYILIAIGRSISSIAELMRQLGANTKTIPLSGLRRGCTDNISPESLRIYKKFLTQIGLTKTELHKNPNKTYILMDYTHYGRSLEKAEKLLKRNELLGDAPNLIPIPVSNVLGDDFQKKGIERLFECNRFKDYSCVGKLDINELNKVFEVCTPEKMKELKGNITQGLRKLFWFNVFDSLKSKSYKNIMPEKELNAVYDHYYSRKAVKNMLKREMQKVMTAANFIKRLG